MEKKFDFSGWATKANVLCSDGRVIMPDAFKHCDGLKVPMVWNHQHNHPDEVLGHALLENRPEGVYAYCSFNDTEAGQNAKICVQHGDIDQLSIFANKLKHQGRNVVHGVIREVSLVLAGANPEAYIDSIIMHGEETDEEGYIGSGEYIECVFHSEESVEEPVEEIVEEPVKESAEETLTHADNEKKGEEKVAEETKKQETAENSDQTIMDVFSTLNEEQKKVAYAMIGQAIGDDDDDEEDEVEHSDADDEELEHADGEKTLGEVWETFSEVQKKVVYAMIGKALEEKENVKHSDTEYEGGNYDMGRNVFDQTQENNFSETLSHSEMKAIMDDAKTSKASLKDTVLAHGIEDLNIMFPDHKSLTNEPEFIKRDDSWVARVLNGVHHTPFARIKTIFADITAAEARAKGYQKGNLKIEEVFKLLKRTTNPTTIYKKQKFDRDDIVDINWDMLPFVKKEMRMMFNEELARAILIGDGRDPVEEANDKIDEECIRPIWKMEELFTVKVAVPVAAAVTAEDKAKAFIKACVKSRKLYKGSGNPVMFMSEDMLTDCLLIEDANQRTIYDTVEKLAAKLRVREIITVPVMDGLTRTDDGKTFELGAIYVNLNDYNVGTDKGGELNFFDDFDIDYNQMKFLLEGRCSGSLTKPYSAVAIEFTEAQ